jgi:hypothetical protein
VDKIPHIDPESSSFEQVPAVYQDLLFQQQEQFGFN